MEAVISNIRSRWPGAELFAFCMNPDDTRARHGIPSYPIRTNTWTLGFSDGTGNLGSRFKLATFLPPAVFRWLRGIYIRAFKIPAACYRELKFLIKSFGILRSFDLLVVSGGGQLTESWGGPWHFPYTVFKWTLLARLAQVKSIFLNVGAGPLAHPLSKYFIRSALSLAEYTSFRDAQSAELVRRIGFQRDTTVAPDAVYSLKIDSGLRHPVIAQGVVNVGIAPMPYGRKPLYEDGNPHAYDSLVGALSAVGSRILTDQGRVTLFCTDIGVDPPSVYDVQGALKNSVRGPIDDSLDITVPRSIAELLRTMSAMEYVITCRFHGVVFAYLLNIPVVALSHHQKITTLMADLGLSYYCLDIKTVGADALADRFACLVQNAVSIKQQMRTIYSSYQDRLARQFDDLFPHTPAP